MAAADEFRKFYEHLEEGLGRPDKTLRMESEGVQVDIGVWFNVPEQRQLLFHTFGASQEGPVDALNEFKLVTGRTALEGIRWIAESVADVAKAVAERGTEGTFEFRAVLPGRGSSKTVRLEAREKDPADPSTIHLYEVVPVD